MNDWFTVEEIDTETFAISEYQHWEETHCYLICGQEKAFLIDTGDINEIIGQGYSPCKRCNPS